MIKEERTIISNDINIGAAIAYPDKKTSLINNRHRLFR